MHLIVVTDDKGKTVALGQLTERTKQHSGIERISIAPGSGHRAHVVPFPEELQDMDLADVMKSAYLDTSGPRPTLKLRGK